MQCPNCGFEMEKKPTFTKIGAVGGAAGAGLGKGIDCALKRYKCPKYGKEISI